MTDDEPRIAVHLNRAADEGRGAKIVEALNVILKKAHPGLYKELEETKLVWLLLYDEPHERIFDLIREVIKKYKIDVTFETTIFVGVPGIGPACGILARPIPGRGTPMEIMTRQCGITKH